MGTKAPPLYEITSSAVGGKAYLHLVGNRPRLATADELAIGLGRLRLRLARLRLGRTQDGWIEVAPLTADAHVTVRNAANEWTPVTFRFRGVGEVLDAERLLAPGESWMVSSDGTDVLGIATASGIQR